MRLGDLDELLEVMSAFEPIVQGRHDGIGLVEHGTWAGLCEIVKDAPTIDAVIIPDCNQCIYNEDISHWGFCEHCIGSTHRNNAFVPKDGERKDGEG